MQLPPIAEETVRKIWWLASHLWFFYLQLGFLGRSMYHYLRLIYLIEINLIHTGLMNFGDSVSTETLCLVHLKIENHLIV